PEASSVSLVVNPSPEEAEHEEHRGQQRLDAGTLVLRVPQPLPLEVIPPHPELPAERGLALAQLGLAVLAAVEVVHESVIGLLAERAGHLETVLIRRRLTLVEGGEIRGANGLRGEGGDPEDQRRDAREEELPSEQRA